MADPSPSTTKAKQRASIHALALVILIAAVSAFPIYVFSSGVLKQTALNRALAALLDTANAGSSEKRIYLSELLPQPWDYVCLGEESMSQGSKLVRDEDKQNATSLHTFDQYIGDDRRGFVFYDRERGVVTTLLTALPIATEKPTAQAGPNIYCLDRDVAVVASGTVGSRALLFFIEGGKK
jgi:hypothetical protein